MQKVVLNLPTAERPMLSHVFPGKPDIGSVLENPPDWLLRGEQVDFDACHWLAEALLQCHQR